MMADLGRQVDAWGAFVPGRAELAPDLEAKVIQTMESRGLEELTVTTGDLHLGGALAEGRAHTIFQQKIGTGATATLALRIAPRGTEDLEISWRLHERNWATWLMQTFGQTGLIIVGSLWTLISVFLIPLGVGVCMVVPGIAMIGVAFGWWGSARAKTQATAYQQYDSRVLAQTVDYCLMASLEELGVSADEMRVLQKAQMEGLGRLGEN